MQEIGCHDPGGVSVQELPAGPGPGPRCRIDAGSTQDPPHGGGRDCHAELCEFAVDPAVSPQRILLRQADDKPGDARDRRRAPWLAPLARVVLLRRQSAVPGQQRRWRHGEDFGPAPALYKPRQGGEPGPVGRGWRSGWVLSYDIDGNGNPEDYIVGLGLPDADAAVAQAREYLRSAGYPAAG